MLNKLYWMAVGICVGTILITGSAILAIEIYPW